MLELLFLKRVYLDQPNLPVVVRNFMASDNLNETKTMVISHEIQNFTAALKNNKQEFSKKVVIKFSML